MTTSTSVLLFQKTLLRPTLLLRNSCICQAKRTRKNKESTAPQQPLNSREMTESEPEVTGDEDQQDNVELSNTGKKIGWSFFPMDENKRWTDEKTNSDEMEEDLPIIDLTNPTATDDDGEFPVYTRDQVLSSCFSVCSWIFLMSFVLRGFALRVPGVLSENPEEARALLTLAPDVTPGHVLVTLGAIVVVSGARVFLYQNWKEFTIATDRSNGQVLPSLGFGDLLFVSFVPGISEELFFRGGLLPAIYADWRGVLLSGVIFGWLHKGGGRNLAFAVWAAAVGCLYGFAFIFTQDIYVPIAAHSCANLFSAIYWIANQDKNQNGRE